MTPTGGPLLRKLVVALLVVSGTPLNAYQKSGLGRRLDAEEVRKLCVSLGHKTRDKAVKQLLEAADEGTKDAKLQVKEFARCEQ